MGKKKKKSARKPTNNSSIHPFWVKMGQSSFDQTGNKNSNQTEQSKPISTLEKTAPKNSTGVKPNTSKDVKSIDEKDRTIIIIDTNETDSENKVNNDEANQASNDNLDFTKDLIDDEIQQMQKKAMQSQPTNSGTPAAEKQGSKAVVQGVKQYSKPNWGKKIIESKITRNLKKSVNNIQQAAALLAMHAASMKQLQQSAPKLDTKVTVQIQQPDPTPPRVPVPEKKAPIGFPRMPIAQARYINYPSGIPRSFYENQTAQTPEPYSQLQSLKPQKKTEISTSNWQPVNTQADTNIVWQTNAPYQQQPTFEQPVDQQTYPQAYSPSDIYTDNLTTAIEDDNDEDLELDSEDLGSGQKRQSAFDRLGPVSQPKKPKLTINLLFNKEQAIREVVDETPKEPEKIEYIPVHLRPEILSSTDPTVVNYLKFWPWKKPVDRLKSVTVRNSKSVMLLEKEQMDELYEKSHMFFAISVKDFPPTWTKENVIDALLDSFPKLIPLFIDFNPQECQFFVLRSRATLLAIHKAGFIVRKDGAELTITIGSTSYTLNHISFIPKLVLRKILIMLYDDKNKCMDLRSFTTKEDISHFIYFPLNRPLNQMTIAEHIQTTSEWENITELILSHNRITSIEDFNLVETTPKLKRLDLSHNYIDKVTALISIRDLGLRSIVLEGNPLCNDYIESEYYVKVLKTMFSSLQEIDGVPIQIRGEMPTFKKHYCPEEAKPVIDKFLEVYFPLLEVPEDERVGIEELYHEKASLTITYRFKLRYSNIYRYFRSIFHRSRMIDECDDDSVEGASEIAEHIEKWPPATYDPCTFTIDVLHHDEYATVFKVAGMLKLTSDSLAEDQHLIAFTKTFVLQSYKGYEYKITNEMVYWDVPTTEYADNAFQITRTLKQKKLSLQLESAPEDDLKEGLLQIFMQLTDLDKNASERCLEQKNWNLKMALDYFMKLLKLDDLETLTKEIKT